jgi:hypothetical protein
MVRVLSFWHRLERTDALVARTLRRVNQMQRYVVLCEFASHTILKRIYSTKEEAQYYLSDIRNEILKADSPDYRILHETEEELLIEPADGEELQRRFYIYGGDEVEVIKFLTKILGIDTQDYDKP